MGRLGKFKAADHTSVESLRWAVRLAKEKQLITTVNNIEEIEAADFVFVEIARVAGHKIFGHRQYSRRAAVERQPFISTLLQYLRDNATGMFLITQNKTSIYRKLVLICSIVRSCIGG